MSGWSRVYRNTVSSMQTHSDALARIQEQIATGQRLLRASDDPADANRVAQLRSQSRTLETYVDNLDGVVTNSEQASAAIQSISSALTRARELATMGTNGTLSAEQRTAVASEIDGLLDQVFSEVNQQSLGRYLFSGKSVTTAPFEATQSADGKIQKVRYVGSKDSLPVPVATGVEYSGLMIGSEIFSDNTPETPEFLGATGLAAGTGRSTVTGNFYVNLSNFQTRMDGDTHGLALGTSTAADTIVGDHTLHIAADGSVSIDGGTPVATNPGDTDVQVTTASGDLFHVDISGWDGTAADITVVGEATIQIDDGPTTAIADFSFPLPLKDEDGKVLHLDLTGVTASGSEPVHVPGSGDLFGALINLRDLMTNEKGLDSNEQMKLLGYASQSLWEVSAAVQRGLTATGAQLQAMDSLRASLDTMQFSTVATADAMSEADLVSLATDLARTETLYEMTLRSASKLLSTSLLDFL